MRFFLIGQTIDCEKKSVGKSIMKIIGCSPTSKVHTCAHIHMKNEQSMTMVSQHRSVYMCAVTCAICHITDLSTGSIISSANIQSPPCGWLGLNECVGGPVLVYYLCVGVGGQVCLEGGSDEV